MIRRLSAGFGRGWPQAIAQRREALARKEVEISAGEWINPDLGGVTFGTYAAGWMQDRVLKPRTAELYDGLLRNHLLPSFGNRALTDIREADVRRWRKERLDAGPHADRAFGPVTVAKAYRLLHGMLATAADDKLIGRNPCRIKGAGEEHSPERPVFSQCRAPRAWSSSVRWVAGCEDQTFAICGSLPLRTRACPTCTFTIFAIPATRWRLLPALACAS
jgi:hypothetical protein